LTFLTAIRRGCRKTLTGSAERERCTSDLWLLACGGPDRRGFGSKTNKIAGDATYRRSKSCGSEHPDQACRGIAHNVSWHMRTLRISRSTYFAGCPAIGQTKRSTAGLPANSCQGGLGEGARHIDRKWRKITAQLVSRKYRPAEGGI
jgi:hypothetical protein